MDAGTARLLWQVLEPYHAVVYFAPEAKTEYSAAGLKGGWMGYFASRSAALGAAPAELVISTFYNFHPGMVRRAIPDAWALSTPARVLEARLSVADSALRRLLGDGIKSPEIAEAAKLARRAAEAADLIGRPLFAAHATLPWPDDAHLALWHAATLLREHRGDGHVASLVVEDIDGCECHVLAAAAGVIEPVAQRQYRGWSLPEWDEAEERLHDRGLLDRDGGLTDLGRRAREDLEDRTDRLALKPYATLADDVNRLEQIMLQASHSIAEQGAVPFPNPMALPRR